MPMPESVSNERMGRLREEMASQGVEAVAIAPGSNMRYLLGFAPLADERPCVLLVGLEGMQFVVPTLNAAQVAEQVDLPLLTWEDSEGPEAALQAAAGEVGTRLAVAFDDTMRADTLVPAFSALDPRRILLASQVVGPLRMRKSAAEVAALACSAALADEAAREGLAACKPGRTEAEVAEAIEQTFRRGGATPAFALVASGPHSAFPHHHTGSRLLQAGEPVLLDLGADLEGYQSDISRMAFLGEPPEEFRRVFVAVVGALDRATDAVRPGARASDVDAAARDYLVSQGYGDYFVHRTGHGIGLDGHEPPSIQQGNDLCLEPGMAFSIEPGVYLPGRFGVRVENIVVVTDEGCRTLTGLPHALHVVEAP